MESFWDVVNQAPTSVRRSCAPQRRSLTASDPAAPQMDPDVLIATMATISVPTDRLHRLLRGSDASAPDALPAK